jgi:hypothetical protein
VLFLLFKQNTYLRDFMSIANEGHLIKNDNFAPLGNKKGNLK